MTGFVKYTNQNIFPLMEYFAYNTGGEPRYDVKFDKVYRELIAKIIISDKERIKKLDINNI